MSDKSILNPSRRQTLRAAVAGAAAIAAPAIWTSCEGAEQTHRRAR